MNPLQSGTIITIHRSIDTPSEANFRKSKGKLDPAIGRKNEIERVMKILCKCRKNNPCLTRDPGVGKNAIVEGMALRIVNSEDIPIKLLGKQIISIDMTRLIAGTTLRGEFEKRLIAVIDKVKTSEGNVILFIDEVHTLIGAGGIILMMQIF